MTDQPPTIPPPSAEDMARDAATDITDHRGPNGINVYEPREWLRAWIRRAVHAEAEAGRLKDCLLGVNYDDQSVKPK